jgi:hypothetical protein
VHSQGFFVLGPCESSGEYDAACFLSDGPFKDRRRHSANIVHDFDAHVQNHELSSFPMMDMYTPSNVLMHNLNYNLVDTQEDIEPNAFCHV